jgi:endoglycosylceramidase
MSSATDTDSARESVTEIVLQDVFGSPHDAVLTHELYTLAARRPAYRTITTAWMARSRAALERWFDPETARALDALIEGMSIHRALDTEDRDPEEVARAVTRLTGPVPAPPEIPAIPPRARDGATEVPAVPPLLHGINLVAKGDTGLAGERDPASFRGNWTREDLGQLRDMGLDAVRLGVMWSAAAPAPGRFDEQYLDWIGDQLDQLHELGFAVVLDAHQDLYSQQYGDGAPDWVTLTDHPFTATDLWSDAYLSSPAVHEAYDAFWANAAVSLHDVPAGTSGSASAALESAAGTIGLQDALADLWEELAARFGGHAAVIGYDVLNEPTPGALSEEAFGTLIGAFAQLTDQDPQQIAADFDDPAAKLAQLGRLDEVAVHRGIGDAVAPLLAPFEQEAVDALFRCVIPRIRRHDTDGWILREHNYFSNLGVPSAMPPLRDARWIYSPHGYDLVVDTDAMPLASDQRIETIFRRAAETQTRLDVPVMVGEWGGFSRQTGIGRHARFQLDLFDELGWSWFYWAWEPDFVGTEAAQVLTEHLRAARV